MGWRDGGRLGRPAAAASFWRHAHTRTGENRVSQSQVLLLFVSRPMRARTPANRLSMAKNAKTRGPRQTRRTKTRPVTAATKKRGLTPEERRRRMTPEERRRSNEYWAKRIANAEIREAMEDAEEGSESH